MHDALLKPMPDDPMFPSLATTWSESADGLTYDFELRQGVKFHNGDPFTAEDVQFSFERYRGAGAGDLQKRVQAVEIVNIRLRAVGLVDKPKKRRPSASGSGSIKPLGVREAWFSSATQTSIYDRTSLYPGARIAGPAVIRELSSATIVPPGASVTVDPQENILLELQ